MHAERASNGGREKRRLSEGQTKEDGQDENAEGSRPGTGAGLGHQGRLEERRNLDKDVGMRLLRGRIERSSSPKRHRAEER